MVDDYLAMSTEEKEKNTISLDEFKARLKDNELN